MLCTYMYKHMHRTVPCTAHVQCYNHTTACTHPLNMPTLHGQCTCTHMHTAQHVHCPTLNCTETSAVIVSVTSLPACAHVCLSQFWPPGGQSHTMGKCANIHSCLSAVELLYLNSCLLADTAMSSVGRGRLKPSFPLSQ